MGKKIIGRIDKANFPELALTEIAIKIDTGAYTSSIHCSEIYVENKLLHCKILDPDHPDYNNKKFIFRDFKSIRVKSSNGIAENRYEIKTLIELFNKTYKIALSLSNRKEMKYPVLIGRRFLTKKFIVDTELANISFNQQANNHEY